ncbi:MAG: MmcB family DNA repair protein [Paracoccaceae bacterium]|nr:MmcB family DNA repair protein [Paracoccaceae bacterium]
MSEKNIKMGQLIARGVCRHLKQYNFSCLEEFVPIKGSRVDIIAIGPGSEIWIIECKSSPADYNQDQKWEKYLPFCDRYFWAVPQNFPTNILPADDGLIIADTYDAEIIRYGPERKLNPQKRKKIITKFAQNASDRLRLFLDPRVSKKYSID